MLLWQPSCGSCNLEATLRQRGWQVTAIRIHVQSSGNGNV
jgi:hypothetical protein